MLVSLLLLIKITILEQIIRHGKPRGLLVFTFLVKIFAQQTMKAIQLQEGGNPTTGAIDPKPDIYTTETISLT